LVISKNESSPLDILATNTDDEIMAFIHKNLHIAGFQFHPESIGTPRGLELFRAWKKWVAKK
jgi:anthranilate synthase component 2